jgi:hypothetical protein
MAPGDAAGITSADTAVDYFIAHFKEAQALEVLSGSDVTVSGVEGEQLACSCIQFPTPFHHRKGEGDVKEETPAIQRKVAFEHGGLIWDIGMMSIEQVAEADGQIFQQILDTFRILDQVLLLVSRQLNHRIR